MKRILVPGYIAVAILCLGALAPQFAQAPQQSDSAETLNVNNIVDRTMRRETEMVKTMTQ